MSIDKHFTVHCTGTSKGLNGPLMLNISIKEIQMQDGLSVGRRDAYQITVANAIELRRELADFLNANNVPTR